MRSMPSQLGLHNRATTAATAALSRTLASPHRLPSQTPLQQRQWQSLRPKLQFFAAILPALGFSLSGLSQLAWSASSGEAGVSHCATSLWGVLVIFKGCTRRM